MGWSKSQSILVSALIKETTIAYTAPHTHKTLFTPQCGFSGKADMMEISLSGWQVPQGWGLGLCCPVAVDSRNIKHRPLAKLPLAGDTFRALASNPALLPSSQ